MFWGVDRVALNAEHHWTPTGGLLSVGLCVCVCSETRPTSDPCTTHTPLSAAFFFLWFEPPNSADEGLGELTDGGQEAVMCNLLD